MEFKYEKDDIVDVKIEFMEPSNVATVMRMEQAFSIDPWTETFFRMLMKQENCVAEIVRYQAYTIGFMVYCMGKNSIEIMNLKVVPQCRRFGIGNLMLTHLRGKLKDRGSNYLTAFVRESDLAGQLFLQQAKFRAEKIMPCYFVKTEESAYFFRYCFNRPESDYAPGLAPSNRISSYIEDGV